MSKENPALCVNDTPTSQDTCSLSKVLVQFSRE